MEGFKIIIFSFIFREFIFCGSERNGERMDVNFIDCLRFFIFGSIRLFFFVIWFSFFSLVVCL